MGCHSRSADCSALAAREFYVTNAESQTHLYLCIASALTRPKMVQVWESHYAKRWRAPVSPSKGAWQMHYSQKMRNARAFSSRGLADVLYGHSGPVFAISLLPACNLLATGAPLTDCNLLFFQ